MQRHDILPHGHGHINKQLEHKRGWPGQKKTRSNLKRVSSHKNMEGRSLSQSPYERFIHSGNAIKHTHSSIDHMHLHSETKMAAQRKCSRPSWIHHRIETECETEAEKEAFSRRF